nr:immunoglobulin light chain junction region [Macaca mulatta]MOW34437.1 immunoglobulin light chain junction region [Macaca mulatta]MOW35654.1 immunoglobulin light chain junction region [Macaca mulatta]MOW35669.1 immunoglobulin light chain junction region [Macaca mulatta]MOW35795.1 immunoglobulin light chain junction region [Macaca mulatta]
CQRFDNFPLTF